MARWERQYRNLIDVILCHLTLGSFQTIKYIIRVHSTTFLDDGPTKTNPKNADGAGGGTLTLSRGQPSRYWAWTNSSQLVEFLHHGNTQIRQLGKPSLLHQDHSKAPLHELLSLLPASNAILAGLMLMVPC